MSSSFPENVAAVPRHWLALVSRRGGTKVGRAKGGNLLLNVGPKPDGELPIEQEERLRELALWMQVNQKSIYGVRPWVITNEQNIGFHQDVDDPSAGLVAIILGLILPRGAHGEAGLASALYRNPRGHRAPGVWMAPRVTTVLGCNCQASSRNWCGSPSRNT